MDGASDAELVGRIADAASRAVLAQRRAIVANRRLLRSVTLELGIGPKGDVTCVDSYVSRRISPSQALGLRG